MSSFRDLNLSEPLLLAIDEMGFETPSPIQAETLPILLAEPTDFLGLAATGTGKTAAFAIPMLEKIDASVSAVQALILCPTRELALQVADQVNKLGRHKGIKSVTIYGGSSYIEQFRGLKEAQVVVGTPGRVVDHIEKESLVLDRLKMMVFDEADEMISMGFKEDLELILGKMPKESSNFWLFSATMSPEIRRVSEQYLRDPKQVQMNRKEVLSSGVQQLYYPAREGDKPEILCKLIEAADDFYGLIFCQTKQLVCDLQQYLVDRGYKVDSLHGDKDQNSRERTMQAFRDRKVSILVCTDVASRGLDVKDITHVINYSLPRELDNYVHRIGRTARSGKTGLAMNLVTYSHRHLIGRIERLTKSRMIEGTIPTRKEIAVRKVAKLLPRFNDQPFASRAMDILGEDWKAAIAGLSAEEVAARFLTMSMPELFNDRVDERAPRISAPKEERPPKHDDLEARARWGSTPGADSTRPARSADESRSPREGADRPRFQRRDREEGSGRGGFKPRFDRREGGFKRFDREGGEGRPHDRKSFKPRFFERRDRDEAFGDNRPAPRPYKRFAKPGGDSFAGPGGPGAAPARRAGFAPRTGFAPRAAESDRGGDRPPRRFQRHDGGASRPPRFARSEERPSFNADFDERRPRHGDAKPGFAKKSDRTKPPGRARF